MASLMELSNVDTTRLMPSVIAEDPDAAALMQALDGLWQEISAGINLWRILATIEQQPEEVVDKLAWQFHVDYWRDDWSLEVKRKAVINSIRLHRIAGTRGAVEDVIRDIWGNGAILTEWWEFGGEPGTFEVALTNSQTQSDIEEFVKSIKPVKRATDHLTITTLNDVGQAEVNAGAVLHIYTYYRL